MKQWAKRREEADDERFERLYQALRYGHPPYWPLWERLPERLRATAQAQMPMWMETEAKEGNPNLPGMITLVRACGMYLPVPEEQQLYMIAMDHAWGVRKLIFAHKIHGENLPLEVVIELLKTQEEVRSILGPDTGYIENYLKEIDRNDPHAVLLFAETIVQKGLYYSLMEMYRQLKRRDPPEEMIRICFEAALHAEQPYYCDALSAMCIALKDWETGDKLIERWHTTDCKPHAAQIALAMHLDQAQTPI